MIVSDIIVIMVTWAKTMRQAWDTWRLLPRNATSKILLRDGMGISSLDAYVLKQVDQAASFSCKQPHQPAISCVDPDAVHQ